MSTINRYSVFNATNIVDGDTGFIVVDTETRKVADTWLYEDRLEAIRRERALNEAETIKVFWPSVGDEEVKTLVNDQSFQPPQREDGRWEGIERFRAASELVARRRAGLADTNPGTN